MTHVKTLFLFFVCASLSFVAQGQHSLESSLNMYRSGDEIVKQQVEYKDPGRTGEDVLWDFSKLSTVDDSYRQSYISYNDTLLIGFEQHLRYYYTLENDSLLLWGFYNPTTQVDNSQPELILEYPMTYEKEMENYFYGHGKYGNKLELDMMGTITTKMDAYGMMIVPGGDTLRHVVRTHSLKLMAKDTKPVSHTYSDKHASPPYLTNDSISYRLSTDSVLFITETFRWYAKGYRYPVFETIRCWEQIRNSFDYGFLTTAFYYPIQEHDYLEDDDENLAILDELENEENEMNNDPWYGLTYNIYPNPAKYDLDIEVYLPKSVNNIRIQLRNTMGQLKIGRKEGSRSEGTCIFHLDIGTLPVDNYILDIWLDDKLINEVILKR